MKKHLITSWICEHKTRASVQNNMKSMEEPGYPPQSVLLSFLSCRIHWSAYHKRGSEEATERAADAGTERAVVWVPLAFVVGQGARMSSKVFGWGIPCRRSSVSKVQSLGSVQSIGRAEVRSVVRFLINLHTNVGQSVSNGSIVHDLSEKKLMMFKADCSSCM